MVLRPSHSLLLVYAGKHLYEKYLNNEQYENTSNQLNAKAYLCCKTQVNLNFSEKWQNGKLLL